jgi:Na+-driven multidrug efflux pump
MMDIKHKYSTLKQKLYPIGFRHDAWTLTSTTFALIISYVFASWMITTVSLVFIGRLGDRERDGCALAITTYVLIGNCVLMGLNFGCDTLLPQCFGGNKKKMGLILQRGIIIAFYACFIIWTLMLNAVSVILMVDNTPVLFKCIRNSNYSFLLIKNK